MSALNVFTKAELITQINKLTDNNKELQAEIEHLKQTVIDLADKLDDTVEECASKYANMEHDLTNKLARIEVKLENAESENSFLEEKLHAIEQRHLQVTVYNHAL